MTSVLSGRASVFAIVFALTTAGVLAQPGTVRVEGTVRDNANAISLPGVPVAAETGETVYTDVDGRYVIDLPAGEHELTVSLDGYQPKTIKVSAGAERNVTLNVALTMNRFSETVTVTGQAIDVPTSTAEAQLIERKQSQVITDNLGSQEMKDNGDPDAASAMARVTGLSVVDNQYIFVRGLGERYSNTTLAGSVLPTTEPDKKVVPLDLFPSGLIDSVQVAKSYTPDKSSEFAGGLVEIVPLKYPSRPSGELAYGIGYYSNATGKEIPISGMGTRDWLGYDNGSRALPDTFPDAKIVRQGIYTPDVGFPPDQITAYGKQLAGGLWRPEGKTGLPSQNWRGVFGNRFDKLGVIVSATQSYKEQALDEQRSFFHVAEGSGENVVLESLSDYTMKYGYEKAQLALVGNVAYQFTTNNRLNIENFYTHTGRDEGRLFEGYNLDNNRQYKNYRLQFVEESLSSNAVGGQHFFQRFSNSSFEWRVNSARATRDEPRLRESLYEYVPPPTGAPTPPFVLADESQSGFQMFNNLDDETWDTSADWSTFRTTGRPTQFKFGLRYVNRTREFVSRRFRFIPITAHKADSGNILFDPTLPPEQLFTEANVGTAFRFNEETRSTDAYDGDQTTTAGYGMVDVSFSSGLRMVAGARVENFNQQVNTFDPFSLFTRTVTAENKNTDVFPAVNFVKTLPSNANLRLSYSTTVNRPEFRELAAFEFTDIVGSRAVRGNPNLKRALIQNVDGRWERFSGGRNVVAVSAFYKYFDEPIENVVLAAAQPIGTFQNSDNARDLGFEFEAAQDLGEYFFLNANYTFVDSKVTLRPEQLTTQTSLERPLVGQSKNLFNLTGEFLLGGFSTRLLFNYSGDRISEAGANEAPDIIEEGRPSFDLVFAQRLQGLTLRLSLENLGDNEYRFTQGDEPQRLYNLGRTVAFSLSYNLF